jgi:hypothetical protein
MTRNEFIEQVFLFFRSKDEELKKAYDLAFSVNYQVDWDKLYNLVINEAETRYLPTPKWFKAKFPMCKVQRNGHNPLDGTNLVITFANGKSYSFVLYETKEDTLEEVEIGLRNKFRKQGKEVKNIVFMES